MRAIVQDRYGAPEFLQLREIERPAIGDDEVLVRVRATSVHPDVWHVVRGRPFVLRLMGTGLQRPKHPVPGTDLAGEVEAVGAAVTRFRRGDAVFGEAFRGYQWRNGGTFAEYAAVPADVLAPKPANLTFEQAAAVPASGFIALSGVREAAVQAGQDVLVNGAGGGVGIYAVQLAKAFGARVTAVDGPGKLDLLRSLGADEVVDFTREDFTRGGRRYDAIVDVPGNHSFAECRRVLAPAGKYVLIGHDGFDASSVLGSVPRFLGLMARAPFTRQLPNADFSGPDKPGAMAVLVRLLEAGQVTPVVDRTFALDEVPAAIRHLESGRARGKIVICV
jgi:NADPH:quinone reductase-like Zn-dependent oxidoreductase